MDYDYIIIGAGLSGATLGYLLRKHGKNVLLVDRADTTQKKKLCGGIVTPKAFNELKTIFSKEQAEKLMFKHYNKCHVISNYNILIDGIDINVTDRKILDGFILEQYKKIGGKIIDKTGVREININSNTVIVADREYTCRQIIAADGATSIIRKIIDGRAQRNNFALESFQSKILDELIIEFKDGFNGYAWIIPMMESTCIGVGEVHQNTNIDDYYIEIANKYGLDLENKKGAFLPTGDDVLLQKNNVMFIGDAAGLISPITGEGIYLALFSARMAYEAIINQSSYEKLMNKECNKIKEELELKKAVYNTSIRNNVFKTLDKNNIISKKIKKEIIKVILS